MSANHRPSRSRQEEKKRRHTTRLLVAAVVTLSAGVTMATLAAGAQPPSAPPVNVGGRLLQPPTPDSMNPQLERGPDGNFRFKEGVMLVVGGPDGQPQHNADGSLKMVSANAVDPPTLDPNSAEAKAASAKARANGVPANVGVTASGDVPALPPGVVPPTIPAPGAEKAR
jgi:hypothetical protein